MASLATFQSGRACPPSPPAFCSVRPSEGRWVGRCPHTLGWGLLYPAHRFTRQSHPETPSQTRPTEPPMRPAITAPGAGPPSLASRICERGRGLPPGVAGRVSGRVDTQLVVVTEPWRVDVVVTAWRPPGPWSLCRTADHLPGALEPSETWPLHSLPVGHRPGVRLWNACLHARMHE